MTVKLGETMTVKQLRHLHSQYDMLTDQASALSQGSYGRGGLAHTTVAGSLLHGLKEVVYCGF